MVATCRLVESWMVTVACGTFQTNQSTMQRIRRYLFIAFFPFNNFQEVLRLKKNKKTRSYIFLSFAREVCV